MVDDSRQMGVVFDMDGVLVDSAAAHFKSWQTLAGEFGREVTEGQFAATFGRQNRDIVPILIGEVAGNTVAALADRKERIYRDLIRNAPPIVDGAVRLTRSLHRAGVKLAVGSSGPRANIDLVLEAMGVGELITAIVSGGDVTRGKPDPQVFTIACRHLKMDPRRCVVIEDAPAGIVAAHAAGTRTIAVLRHHPAEAFSKPDLVVQRLADLSVDSIVALVGG
ncbi:MAG: HAD family hydrolase [Phycisphaerae bacterium]